MSGHHPSLERIETSTGPSQSIEEVGTTLMMDAENFLSTMIQPWRIYQVCIIIALFAAAHVFSRWLVDPRLNTWIESHKTTRPTVSKLVAAIKQRSRGLIFILLAWITIGIMREVTWPSRSYLILLYANLATAWVFVGLVTRLVRNQLLSKILRYGAWIYVTLRLTGYDQRAFEVLDALGVQVGSLYISVLSVMQSIAVLAILLMMAAWITSFAHNRIEKIQDLSPSMQVLVEKLITLIAYGIAVLFAVRSLGFDLTSLAVLSGAIGVGIGFGLQKIVSNLVSGFILLLDKSIKPGDVISLGDTFGWIQNLSARYVSVLTRDGREYLIPNEDLITGQVVNWSHSSKLVRLDIHFGVDYASDPHLVRKIAREAASSVDRVETHPASVCHITGFGDSSIDFVLRFWIDDPSGGLTNIRGNVYLALWDTLKEHNINIPFPRRDVQILPDTAFATPTAIDT